MLPTVFSYNSINDIVVVGAKAAPSAVLIVTQTDFCKRCTDLKFVVVPKKFNHNRDSYVRMGVTTVV